MRWRKDGYDIVRCPSCGLLARATLPTEAELAELYSLEYFRATSHDGQGYLDYVGDAELHRETARRRLERLERIHAAGRLLDVGAAAGFFVAEARERGWEAHGIDISAPMVAWGVEQLHVPLAEATLAAAPSERASLDAVTMWDYIEHALDPAADLERVRQLLRPDGVLALSTGDASAVVARISGVRWHLLTPRHHNFFFSFETLRRLLMRTGFTVIGADRSGARYPLRYLAHKARTLVRGALIDRAASALDASRLGSIAVPLNLFDIVTVVARPS